MRASYAYHFLGLAINLLFFHHVLLNYVNLSLYMNSETALEVFKGMF
jgi:hypothetical protein